MDGDITPSSYKGWSGLKHIGVIEPPESVDDEDGGDEAWKHPLVDGL
jgi:hypothetical protein